MHATVRVACLLRAAARGGLPGMHGICLHARILLAGWLKVYLECMVYVWVGPPEKNY